MWHSILTIVCYTQLYMSYQTARTEWKGRISLTIITTRPSPAGIADTVPIDIVAVVAMAAVAGLCAVCTPCAGRTPYSVCVCVCVCV